MNKLFITLSIMMGVVVLSSNYLVQFPINYFGLNEILTYGAFSYPIAFLITDLANRSYGKLLARQIVYLGFLIGIIFTLLFSTDFADLISVRIAAKYSKIVGADINELSPIKGFNSYNFLVAKLAYKILSYKFLY